MLCCAVPCFFVVLRVRRHMYLESKLPQLQPQGGVGGLSGGGAGGALAGLRPSPHSPFNRLALPPMLTDKAKEVGGFFCRGRRAAGGIGRCAVSLKFNRLALPPMPTDK